MALSRRSKLPPLKLTVWTGSGTPTTQLVHRGLRSAQVEPSGSSSSATGVCKDMASDGDVAAESTIHEQQSHRSGIDLSIAVVPSHYEIEAKASAKHWANIRKQFIFAHTEETSMPECSACILCSKTAELRCKRCGPHVFYCNSCFRQQHCSVNIFHVAEKWQVSERQLIFLWNLLIH